MVATEQTKVQLYIKQSKYQVIKQRYIKYPSNSKKRTSNSFRTYYNNLILLDREPKYWTDWFKTRHLATINTRSHFIIIFSTEHLHKNLSTQSFLFENDMRKCQHTNIIN